MPLVKGLAAAIALAATSAAFGGVVNTVNSTSYKTPTVDGTVAANEYISSVSGGGSGFGGPVGNGLLDVAYDASGVYFGFHNMGDISGNSIRVYFDTKSGGYNNLSDASGFNDFGDFGRERLSRPASGGLTLPFDADYGWIISPAFGGFQALFQLVPGGNNSLNFSGFGVTGSAIGENPSNSTYEFFVPYVDIGTTQGSTIDFAVIYANNSDQDNAYMSDEGFPFQTGGNPGNGPATISNFHRIDTSIPEPASLGLLALAGIGLTRSARLTDSRTRAHRPQPRSKRRCGVASIPSIENY